MPCIIKTMQYVTIKMLYMVKDLINTICLHYNIGLNNMVAIMVYDAISIHGYVEEYNMFFHNFVRCNNHPHQCRLCYNWVYEKYICYYAVNTMIVMFGIGLIFLLCIGCVYVFIDLLVSDIDIIFVKLIVFMLLLVICGCIVLIVILYHAFVKVCLSYIKKSEIVIGCNESKIIYTYLIVSKIDNPLLDSRVIITHINEFL